MAERRKSPIAHLSKPMKLASIVPAVVGAALFVSWIVVPAPIYWITSEQEGRAKALAEGKPMIIDFGANWCDACRDLERDTFPDANVQAEAKRFVAIHVDMTNDEDPEVVRLQQTYKPIGLPTVILLSKDGKEITRFKGFVAAPKFLAALKKVPTKSGDELGMK